MVISPAPAIVYGFAIVAAQVALENPAWLAVALQAAGILVMVGMHFQIVRGVQSDVAELKKHKVDKESYAADRDSLGGWIGGIEDRCTRGRGELSERVRDLELRRR